jgi:hypothetical protein
VSIAYDTWSPYDPNGADSPKNRARLHERLERDRQIVRKMLPRLEREIENPRRDLNSVGEVLRPYHLSAREAPMTPADLPELERLCRLVLERGGSRQNDIQEVLLRLIGATAAVESAPFLLEMLHYTRRGDRFGPQRRQLALWGLARVALFHNLPEAYSALQGGLDDRNADVRYATADMVLNAYLRAGRDVPQDVVDRLRHMARSDPDDSVRRAAQRYLREPWARAVGGDAS